MKIIAQVPVWILFCLFALSHVTEAALSAALPNIADNFNVSASVAQITSTIYFFGFAIGILSLGRISDIYGRRPVILCGIALYLFASCCSIFAPSIEVVIALRFIQAFGASVGSVIGQAMARDSYQGKELSYIYASLSMGLAFAPSIGSGIGGYIVEYANWRYIFALLSCSAACLLLLYFKLLPETNPYIGKEYITSYFGVARVVIKDKILLLYSFLIGTFNGMCVGFYMEAPFIFIDKVGLAPSIYGRLVLLLSAAHLLGSSIARRLVRSHTNTKNIMLAGITLSVIGSSCLIISTHFIKFSFGNKYIDIMVIFLPMALHMVGHSIFVPMALRHALEDYAKVTGTAGSIFGALYYFIIAVITFVVSTIHDDYSVVNFTVLLFILSNLCCFAFYLITKYTKQQICEV
jgi:MFS transporter, DHA1 family, multidrug resistance protein